MACSREDQRRSKQARRDKRLRLELSRPELLHQRNQTFHHRECRGLSPLYRGESGSRLLERTNESATLQSPNPSHSSSSLYRNGFVCQSCWCPLGLGCLRAHVNHHRKVASITPVDGFCLHRKTDLLNTLLNVTTVHHAERRRGVQIEPNARDSIVGGLEIHFNFDGEFGFDAAPH